MGKGGTVCYRKWAELALWENVYDLLKNDG